MMSEKKSSEKHRLVNELHAPARRNFPRRRIIVWGYDDLCKQIWSRCVLTRDSTKVIITFSPLSICWASMHRRTAQDQEWKWCSYSDRKNNSRRWKMSEKFADWQRKEILQCKRAETHEETWYQSLFDIFRNESIGCRTIQPYVEEWYVETVYA